MVITVPAYFGVLEREATRKAGQIAGLNVLDVLAEPVAAALNYQALERGRAGVRHIFIYDLGGGTFDTTVIRIDGDDIQVVCTDGNHHLGGADWDSAIIDFLLRGFTDQYPQLDPGGDEQFMQDLATSAEQLKKALSATQARKHNVRFDGSVVQLELTREHLEELTVRVARAHHGDHRADDRHRAGEGRRAVRRRAPGGRHDHHAGHRADAQGAVRARRPAAGSASGRGQGRRAVRPHEEGEGEHAGRRRLRPGPRAAQQVADQLGISVEQVENMAAKHVATVVPRAFGLKVVDSKDPISRPTRTGPASTSRTCSRRTPRCPPTPARRPSAPSPTTSARSSLEVWEQAGSIASEELEHNTHIGEGMLSDLPPRPAGAPFQVVFHMTETGLLKVHGREADSGREVRFEIQIGGLDETEVQQATAAVARYEVSG